MSSYRPVLSQDSTVIQSSMTVNVAEYKHLSVNSLMLGVVLDVVPIDWDQNRSSMQTIARKGHIHECTVLIVNDSTPAYMTLEHVLITPDSPSGLDDFVEKLPRGSSSLVSGGEYNVEMHGIDPYDLDGDWCVVGFMGGDIQAPFIVRWWSHARNTFDAASSGKGLEGNLLVQDRRYFRRTNGVETIITSKGDIVVSTTRANSVLTPSEDPAFGRVARTLNEAAGGSIRLNVKPSQTFEVTFNPQDEGIGVSDIAKPETYIYADRDQVAFIVPTSVTVTTQDTITLTATNVVELEAETIKLGTVAEDNPVVLGEELRTWLRDVCVVLSPFGPLKIDPATLLTPFDPTQSTKSFVE